MKRAILVAGALALTMVSGAAMAAAPATPPTAAQKATFLKECLHNSGGNTTLCNCKADVAMKIIDTTFMALVIGAMNGKTIPVDQSRPYGVYISQSNSVCAPGM